jgi:hypothetical protein
MGKNIDKKCITAKYFIAYEFNPLSELFHYAMEVQTWIHTKDLPGTTNVCCLVSRFCMPTDNQIFRNVEIEHIGQVKISFGQLGFSMYLPDGLVVQKINVEPCHVYKPSTEAVFHDYFSTFAGNHGNGVRRANTIKRNLRHLISRRFS